MARENYAYWLIQEIIAKEIQEAFKIPIPGNIKKAFIEVITDLGHDFP